MPCCIEGFLKGFLPLLLLLILPTPVHAQFNYTTTNGTITITEYTGPGGDVIIPGTIDGLPVTSIGDAAFFGCSGLTTVTIPDSVVSIGSHAFVDCTSLTSVAIPNSVTSIGKWAFYYCRSLTSITIGNGVTTIADFTFENCTSLTSVTIPDSVTRIGDGAFIFCSSLTSVAIGSGVTDIGWCAFSYCSSLTAITVDEFNFVYSSVDGLLCDKSQTTLIQCPEGRAGNYRIPDIVTRIGDHAFSNCRRLTSVTIPKSVTNIGRWAFSWCVRLTGLYFLGNAPSLDGALGGRSYPTVYYLPWTTGWEPTYGGFPTALWNPVEHLKMLVDDSAVRKSKPLTATLSAARASIDRGNSMATVHQLNSFQNKVTAQVAPSNPVLAQMLIQAAQEVIDILRVAP